MNSKDYITLEELQEKEKQYVAEYNESLEKGLTVFAEHAIKKLESVRFVRDLIRSGI